LSGTINGRIIVLMALAMEALAHEEIRVEHGPRTGLPMVVAVHRTYRGRSLGGCRLWNYDGVDAAIRDAERLSEAMTFKAAAAGLPVGGGKAVIALAPGETLEGDRRRAAFHDFAELVDALDGRYVTAEDVGVGEDDMAEIARHTRHVVGGPVALGGAGDPSPYTALGVELAIRTALGEDDLDGAAITVAGLGHVGASLAGLLARAGAHLTVTDHDPAKRALAHRLGAHWVEPGEAIAAGGDVLAPCALGGVLDHESVARLRVAVVAGAANNQLADRDVAAALRERGILWAPDFITNAGGLVHVACELDGYDVERVRRGVQAIGTTLGAVFDRARAEDITTLDAAEALVAERLAARH
jgi:leucine dehydrogenase